MIRVNLVDGTTSTFDLEDEHHLSRWNLLQSDRDFQASISGVQLSSMDGKQKHVVTLPRPKNVRSVSWEAYLVHVEGEVRREVVRCYADGICVTLTAYRSDHRSVSHRVDVSRFGRRVLFPPGRRGEVSDKMGRGS